MPFKSEKQRKWMHANKPKMAKKWEKEKSVDEFRIPSGEQKLVYQFKGFTASQMDELHAMLHRAGIVTTPDFNKRTITTHANRDAMKIKKNKTIQRFIKSKGGKQIKESVNKNKIEELKTKAKLTKDKVKKINKYIWSSPKRIVTQSQYNRMQNYNKMRKNGIDYVGTSIDGKLVFLPVVIESVNEAQRTSVSKSELSREIKKIRGKEKGFHKPIGATLIFKLAHNLNAPQTVIYKSMIKYKVGTEYIKGVRFEGLGDKSVNEAMSESQRFKVYNSLKKGDIVSIKYDSSIQKGTKYIPYVVTKGKTKLMKGKIERIILKNPKNPRFKAYLYNRDGDVSLALGDMAASIVDMKKGKVKESVKEERDYKDEYKKFQSSTKSKKYRAELNKYNRKKGTYGNGDGKDASHKGGKIVGFESQSKNRGRAEKSRLKKEGVITENPAAIAAGVRAAMARAKEKELAVGGGKKVKVSTALANKSHPKHKQAKGIIQRIKDKAKSMLAKSKNKKDDKPKKQSAPTTAADFRRRRRGESVDEGQKRDANNLTVEFGKSYQKFTVAVNGLAKSMDNITGEKTDGKIIMKAFKKHIIPFVRLVDSWNQTQQKNPHIDEKKGDFLDSLFPKAKVDKAIKIAKSMGGDMSGAVKKIEKMFKGMSKHTKVQDALRQANEGFGGQLKGADKKKFEKARTKNGEQLGYKLTGTSDVKVVSEKLKK